MHLGVIFSLFIKWQFHSILTMYHSSNHFCLYSSQCTYVVILLCPRYNRKKIVLLTCRSIFITEAIRKPASSILKYCQYNQSEHVRPSGYSGREEQRLDVWQTKKKRKSKQATEKNCSVSESNIKIYE